jgi:hypothetical protein
VSKFGSERNLLTDIFSLHKQKQKTVDGTTR